MDKAVSQSGLALALLMLAAAGASARPLERELPPKAKACWSKVYDEGHLKAHPKQRVTAIKLVHLPDDWSDSENGRFYVDLRFKLRGKTSSNDFEYSLSAFCGATKGGLICKNEWDAGTWRISASSGGLLIRNGGMIIANPIPYDAEEIADGAVRIRAEPDDRAWLLDSRTSDASCKIE